MGRERNQRSEYIARKRGIRKTATPNDLQRQVADHGADRRRSSYVPGATAGGIGGGVQRRIERRIRNQGEDKEDREDQNQETDQLIEPPVGRGSKGAGDE